MATTWGWSCSDCQQAETGFQTKSGAQSALNKHKKENPTHHPVLDEVNTEDKELNKR